MKHTTTKIALVGPFGHGNLGDAAIQEAMMQNIRRHYPDVEITGVSMNPEDTKKRHGIPSFPIGRVAFGWGLNKPPERSGFYRFLYQLRTKPPRPIQKLVHVVLWLPTELVGYVEAFRFLKDKDMLIVSGGGQLDDYWGGPWHHPLTLMMWGIMARMRNVPHKFVSVGAGPLDTVLGRFFDRMALSLASYRSYRDEKSKNYIANVAGFRRDDPVYPDLAFSLCPEFGAPLTQSSNPIVAIGPMAYFDPRVWPEKDQQIYQSYLTKLADFIIWLIPKGYSILLFPGEADHDRDVINDLKEILAQKGEVYDPARILHPPIETVNQLMTELATAKLVVASRFHGVLLAKLLHKPLVALSYHSKVDELMNDTGQSDYCLPIRSFDLEQLKTRFSDLENHCDAICQQLAQRVNEYQLALAKQYDLIFRKS